MELVASPRPAAPPPMSDLTRLCERVAADLRAAGVAHPVAAAVALAARGVAGVERERWAARLGLELVEVVAAETGEVPFGELDPAIGAAAHEAGLDLVVLADLARRWSTEGGAPGGGPSGAGGEGGVMGERPPGGT